ncbi:BQ2448_3057 [Microbotryum intermedium]|uniref:BQ2448_3057 protein n=1 Tax=Microbotryum intermedium TaxID=269621 RepID=A0A238FF91_9BASI|nr:BQ2448_3057 [Microbotryum intermedium]
MSSPSQNADRRTSSTTMSPPNSTGSNSTASSSSSPHRPQLSPKDLNRGAGSNEYFGLCSSSGRRTSPPLAPSANAPFTFESSSHSQPYHPSQQRTESMSHSFEAAFASQNPPSSLSFMFNLPGATSQAQQQQQQQQQQQPSRSPLVFPPAGWPQSNATPTPNVRSASNEGFNFGASTASSSSTGSSSSSLRLQRTGFDSIRGPSPSATSAEAANPMGQPSGPSPFFDAPTSASSANALPSTSSSGANFTINAPPMSFALRRPTSSTSSSTSSVASSSISSSGGPSLLSQSTGPTSAGPAAPSKLTSVSPSALLDMIVADESSVLVLDMRTHTTYLSVHLRPSVNICIPSTLLRRPAYGIDRVSEGLPPNDQSAFARWSAVATIAAFDADSNARPDASPMTSLLNKFDKTGTSAQLLWVKGGWAGLKKEIVARGLQDSLLEYGPSDRPTSPASEAGAESEGRTPTSRGGAMEFSSPGSKKHARSVLQVRDLPIAAFQQSSTQAFVQSGGAGMIGGRPTAESNTQNDSGSEHGRHSRSESQGPGVIKRMKSGYAPYSSSSSNNGWEGSSEQGSSSTDSGADRRVATNPFFDNIRQNSEALSLTRMLENLSPIEFDAIPAHLRPHLPPFLSALIALPPFERARVLAYQFYELESAERKRLQGALNWHANVQGKDGEHGHESAKYQKFGISAGVELGGLNRFKNIFPYEHARVKLDRHASGATDYVNASHIQLAGSKRRFIASQGPLPSTYADFWQTCEQHHVGVVVMLTNLVENGREKCGRYWGPQSDDGWVVEASGGGQADKDDLTENNPASDGGFFAMSNAEETKVKDNVKGESTVRRTILVRRKSAVEAAKPPRKVRHIHYRAWPDFDIPASPYELVDLVHEVEDAQEAYKREVGWPADHDDPPIVVNCAAGCGRTGVFIIISTMLDALRQSRKKKAQNGPVGQARVPSKDRMEVDTSPLATPTPTPGAQALNLSSSSFDFRGRTQQRPQIFLPVSTPSSLIPETASLSLNSPGMVIPAPTSGIPSAFDFSSPSASTNAAPNPPSQPQQSMSQNTAGPVLPLTLPDSPGYHEPALESFDPIFAGVNEMRVQRMSMVANYRQFVCVHECVLVGVIKEMQKEI